MSQDGTLLKGDWQLAIERGDRLEDILHNPKKVGGILRAVQQVSAHEGSLLSEHVLTIWYQGAKAHHPSMCHGTGDLAPWFREVTP